MKGEPMNEYNTQKWMSLNEKKNILNLIKETIQKDDEILKS